MLFVGLLAIIYLLMFVVIAIYAKRTGRSALGWLLLSLILTPFIALIILRGNALQKQRATRG
ncbi:hypothetical protein [Jeongeupia sp. USM3]|uniref:hypothetical protein n=1 Tax=Jeongeupia sp. USM3 TaxID=1906741 RepID=UPI00089DF2ED|nr:hypothetical protein [Jeongeupia sp. USM3]AOX99265.1 hypothetical protein BJP62_01635 [Jeongeupia sp. USM3]